MSDVRWGILGAAKFAREHMGPALTLAPGGHIAALATSDPAKAEPFRAFAPGLRVHDSYDALLADPADRRRSTSRCRTGCMWSGASRRCAPASTCCARSR